jgi:tRNA1(Val) A37 N6-methylase TrmN6
MEKIKQVDKDTRYMLREHGTVCLITEPGRADRLLELAHKRRVNQACYLHSPIDSWDI